MMLLTMSSMATSLLEISSTVPLRASESSTKPTAPAFTLQVSLSQQPSALTVPSAISLTPVTSTALHWKVTTWILPHPLAKVNISVLCYYYCVACNMDCKYCTSSSKSACLKCEQGLNKVESKALSYGDETSNCLCNFGTKENVSTRLCDTCNELCWVCNDMTNLKCDMCSDKAFRVFDKACEAECPAGYEQD